MILLTRGETNDEVTLTCNEKKTINSPYYIFKFVNIQTNDIKIFYTPNTSINKDRYDLFTIEETNTEDLMNGQVTLIAGDWNYYIYESTTISLDSIDWIGEVENGKVKVIETENSIATFDANQSNIAAYRPS